MNTNSVHFLKHQEDWTAALFGGAFAQILYNVFSMQLYHYYIYFYVVGIILLIDSIIGWGKLNSNGINIRLGFIFKKNLNLEWKDIIKVEVKGVKETSVITSGGLSKIPFVHSDYAMVLVFTLKNKLNYDIKSKICAINKYGLFPPKLGFDDQQGTLIVYEKPDGGFTKVVNNIKRYASNEIKIEIEKNKNSLEIIQSKVNAKRMINVSVVLFALSTIIYYL